MAKKKQEDKEYKPFLVFDVDDAAGIPERMYKPADFNDLSKGQDSSDDIIYLGTGGGPTTPLPNPIKGYTIQLPDGDLTTVALGWAVAGEEDSGRYRIGLNKYGEAVQGDLKFDWNATRLRLDTGFSLEIGDLTANRVVYVTTNGQLTDDVDLTFDGTILTVAKQFRVGTTTDTANAGGFAAGSTTDRNAMWFEPSVTTFNGQNTAVFGIGISRARATTNVGANGWGIFNIFTNAEDSNVLIGECQTSSPNAGFIFRGRRSIPTTITTQSGDYLGGIYFEGYDSAATPVSSPAGQIDCLQTSAPFVGGVSGAMLFSTRNTSGVVTELLRVAVTELVINENAADIDFRIEGDNASTLFLTDAGTDRISSTVSDTSVTPIYSLIQSSTGDSALRFAIGTTVSWAIGIDNSAADAFKISAALSGSAVLGTNDFMTVTTAGDFAFVTTTGNFAFTMARSGTSRTYGWFFNSAACFFGNTTDGTADFVVFQTSGSGSEGVVINESQADRDFRVEGASISHFIFCDATATTENIALLATAAPNWQGMDRGIFIGDTSAAPAGNPASGGFLYSEAGALKWRGSGGTITTIAAA